MKPRAGPTETFAYGMLMFLPPWNPAIPGQATVPSDLLPNPIPFAKELYSRPQESEAHGWKQAGLECIRQGWGARKMSHFVKWLPYKHGSVFNPQKPHKYLGVVLVHMGNPGIEETYTGGPVGLLRITEFSRSQDWQHLRNKNGIQSWSLTAT